MDYNETSADNGTSAITVTNQGQAAPATDVSDSKGSTKSANKQAESKIKESILKEINQHFTENANELQKRYAAAVERRKAEAAAEESQHRAEGQDSGGQRADQAPATPQRSEAGEPGRNAGEMAEGTGNLPMREAAEPVVNAKLSEEQDEEGKPFVEAADGSIEFGSIEPESGLAEAPIRLSLGRNNVDEKGDNHGYGLLHIEASHGSQIRNAGYSSVEEFVEEVAKNYTTIREGTKIGNKQTYLLEVSDELNNTLYIQLSNDGTYWNINSAGIFRKRYSRNMPKVYDRPAVGDGKGTDTTEVNSGQTEGATAPAGNSSETSGNKVSTLSTDKQGDSEKSSGNFANPNPTEAQKKDQKHSDKKAPDDERQDLTTTIHSTSSDGTKVVISDKQSVKKSLKVLSDKYNGITKTRGFISDLVKALGQNNQEKGKQSYVCYLRSR